MEVARGAHGGEGGTCWRPFNVLPHCLFFFIIWAHVQALMLLADPFPQLANSVQSELNFKQARICCDPPAACQTVLQSSPEGANSTESVNCQLL